MGGGLFKTNITTMNKEEELLDVTLKILVALEEPNLKMNQEDRDSLDFLNDSMSFFIEQGELDRALQEGKQLLKKLDEIRQV